MAFSLWHLVCILYPRSQTRGLQMKYIEEKKQEEVTAPMISIVPMQSDKINAEQCKLLLELQLKMATSSINHEYARLELEENSFLPRHEELLEYMEDCRSEYLDAREKLMRFDPDAAEEFERDLQLQKQQSLLNVSS